MNFNQQKIFTLLSELVNGNNCTITPATMEQIGLFKERTAMKGVPQNVITQLVEFYEVADFFYYEIIIGFHHCDDPVIFEWWEDRELWLGQRDLNTLRWCKEKFCLGDASNISFSTEHEFDTLIGLIEGCIADIHAANSYGKSH